MSYLSVVVLYNAVTLLCLPLKARAFQTPFSCPSTRKSKPMTLLLPEWRGGRNYAFRQHSTISSRLHLPFTTTRLCDKEDPNEDSSSSNDNSLIWSSLATTEEWIQRTLNMSSNQQQQQQNKAGKNSMGDNPYTRKEVSYDCETSSAVPRIVSGIFRRLREMREAGEDHGHTEDERVQRRKKNRTFGEKEQRPTTYRQTLVVVIPKSQHLSESFDTFDELVQRINEARRNARDYVTEKSLQRVQKFQQNYQESLSEEEEEWVTSVNLAHLHPHFGERTPSEAKDENDDKDEDPRIKAYKIKKMEARRSPYPSLVIEVKSVPPMPAAENQAAPPPSASTPGTSPRNDNTGNAAAAASDVSFSDVQKLEALFGKAASPTSGEEEEENNNDQMVAEDEFNFLSPIGVAQNWITQHDPLYLQGSSSSTFAASDLTQVDEAYEFVFHSISASAAAAATTAKARREYLILPRFLSRSATSLEKFANQLQRIMDVVPGLDGLTVVTFHKEHVNKDRRSPVPILALDWGEPAFE